MQSQHSASATQCVRAKYYLMMAGSEIGGAASTRRSMRRGQARAVLNATLAPQCHPMTQKYCACAARQKAVSNNCWDSSGM